MMKDLKIESISINELKSYENNSKIHDENQVRKIADSIYRFGFNNPLILDESNTIISGHGRLAAAKLLELQEVPAIKLSHLSEAEKKAYRIADNKLTELGKFDTDLLKLEFSEIEKLSIDLDEELTLDITGFDFKEIDIIMDDVPSRSKEDQKINTIPFIPDNEIVSKQGDIWLLGKHRIMHRLVMMLLIKN